MTMQEMIHEATPRKQRSLEERAFGIPLGAVALDSLNQNSTPEGRALGLIEHLIRVVEGKEDHLKMYFVLTIAEHTEMHDHILAKLGLEPANSNTLAENQDPTLIHVVTESGEIDLIRTARCIEAGEAFDVSYATVRTTDAA